MLIKISSMFTCCLDKFHCHIFHFAFSLRDVKIPWVKLKTSSTIFLWNLPCIFRHLMWKTTGNVEFRWLLINIVQRRSKEEKLPDWAWVWKHYFYLKRETERSRVVGTTWICCTDGFNAVDICIILYLPCKLLQLAAGISPTSKF